jgi:hypothetical protein
MTMKWSDLHEKIALGDLVAVKLQHPARTLAVGETGRMAGLLPTSRLSTYFQRGPDRRGGRISAHPIFRVPVPNNRRRRCAASPMAREAAAFGRADADLGPLRAEMDRALTRIGAAAG